MPDAIFSSFGLRENPFRINPDPRFIFLTEQAEATLAELSYGIRSRKGLIVLAGEVGTGKTMLLRRLLDWLSEQEMPTALIFNSHIEPGHLLDFILNDFGIPCESNEKSDKLLSLNRWLLERYRAGQTPVLIVDEAQGLSPQALEEIRLLLNFETPSHKLLQVILSGQPELEDKLKTYELRQLRQRITIRCKTQPLTPEQTRGYIRERLRIAGAGNEPIFEPDAVTYVHAYSHGIPRVINVLCDHSLVNSCAEGFKTVSPRSVEQAARQCQLEHAESIARLLNSGASTGLGDGSAIFAAVSQSPVPSDRPDPLRQSAAADEFAAIPVDQDFGSRALSVPVEIPQAPSRTAATPSASNKLTEPQLQAFDTWVPPAAPAPRVSGSGSVTRKNFRFDAPLVAALRIWRSWHQSLFAEVRIVGRQTRRLLRSARSRYWKPFLAELRHKTARLQASAVKLAADPRWQELRNRSASKMRTAWSQGKAAIPVWLAAKFGSAPKKAASAPEPTHADRRRSMFGLKRWLHKPLGNDRRRDANPRKHSAAGQ